MPPLSTLMHTIDRKSFEDVNAFQQFASNVPLLFFYVYDNAPDNNIIHALQVRSEREQVIMLNVADDSGFLAQTQVTVEITQDHQFISKPLSQVRGVGDWAKGTLVDFAECAAAIPELMERARRFAFPPSANHA